MVNFSMTYCPWILSLLAATSVRCDMTTILPFGHQKDGVVSKILGFPETIARALDRIRVSTHDHQLLEDLWFEKLHDNVEFNAKHSALKSPPSNLVELADAVFDTHRLSWHNAIVQGIDLNVYKDKMQRYRLDFARQNENDNYHNSATRTFGLGVHRRRMQFMLPVMYKLGVITTLLTGLTVLTLKGVTIGAILLVLAVASIATKLHSNKSHQYFGPSPYWSGHDPYDRSHTATQQFREKNNNIHVHVHTAPGGFSGAGANGNNIMYAKSSPPTADGSADDNSYNYVPSTGSASYYWNRDNQDYYDYNQVTDQHHHNNNNNYHYRRNKHIMDRRLATDAFDYDDAKSPITTTTNSIYQRWLG